MRHLKLLFALCLLLSAASAIAQDHYREKRWSDQIVPGLVVGEAVWIEQANQHKFLALWTEAENARGAIILAHGRGWSPDFELYGVLRVKLAEKGYSTLSIQLPVLGGGAKVGDYMITYPDAKERFALAGKWLADKGFKNIAIVSHSLGATMANQYLIDVKETPAKAWVFIGIINGLEEMFRIKIPVLDVFGSKDWEVTQVGAYERQKQISKIAGSQQVVVKDALHFFEGKEDELTGIVIGFLDSVFQGKANSAAR
ncbi:MAG: alpha/beta hydrolase family protein [Burkholderiales bacterium]|nr:alpha/beta hydrolase family protein [Burkholderiales bacterium]